VSINIESFVQKENGRIFVDIALQGCGSGCSYCYIPSPSKSQQLIELSELKDVTEYIEGILNPGDIISFCPNTEPLKTEKSRDYIYYIIKHFAKDDVVFQIATKESIPESFLRRINELSTIVPITVSVSIPLLETNLHEPKAAQLQERLDDFRRISKFDNLRSCFYIKPFFSLSMLEKDRFCELINEYAPDDVCVGLEFEKDSVRPCATLHHPVEAGRLLQKADDNKIYEFARYLRDNTEKKVFHSSVCIVANRNNAKCLLDIKNKDNIFCADCCLMEKSYAE
jgi:DNA repair photolyase